MKVAVECECELMQKTLELFLHNYLDENPDIIISDVKKECKKPLFYINEKSPYLNIPFSKEELMYALEEFSFVSKTTDKFTKQENLESKISSLFDEFKIRLVKTIKEHYE
ncbi:MAG: hypothetical protein GX282_07715 [Campylobacteraceae bacterium]|nr:hypothetical protein [Campylobacteraceae bacterium]